MGHDINDEVRKLLRKAIKNSPMSREQIAEKLTEIAGFKVTVNNLNDWCASSKSKVRFPLAALPAFCEIVGSDKLALLAMPEKLRENAKLGEALRPILEKWALKNRTKPRARRPQTKGGSK